MGIFYFFWLLITAAIFAVYRHIGTDKTVDVQYFLSTAMPEELPTT